MTPACVIHDGSHCKRGGDQKEGFIPPEKTEGMGKRIYYSYQLYASFARHTYK